MYRATIESIAYGFAAIDDRLTEVLGEAPEVIASGGALARSRLFQQVLADSLGREIASRQVEASRHGAAVLALRGSGLTDDLDAAPAPRARAVRPKPEHVGSIPGRACPPEALYEAILG